FKPEKQLIFKTLLFIYAHRCNPFKVSGSNKISRSERLILQAFKNVQERRNGKLNSKENENETRKNRVAEKSAKVGKSKTDVYDKKETEGN
ncbi:hypothetical protein, partial [Winogradskyella damuponensis]|uniref:hypothetical protein n=1 Tax=Winogradskyella damuponensis TaxID=943939 RepID=UPI0031D058F8